MVLLMERSRRAREALARHQPRQQFRLPRLLQILRLHHRKSQRVPRSPRLCPVRLPDPVAYPNAMLCASRVPRGPLLHEGGPAHRHLLPHVPVDELHHRRLPRHIQTERSFIRFLTFVSSSRSWWPGRSSAPATCCRSSRGRRPSPRQDIADGLSLFLVGFFKKVALADYLASMSIWSTAIPASSSRRR